MCYEQVVDGTQITIGFHVDDLLITCADKLLIDDVIKCLQSEFREVKEKRDDDKIGYLRMRIESKEDGLYLDMDVFTKKIVE